MITDKNGVNMRGNDITACTALTGRPQCIYRETFVGDELYEVVLVGVFECTVELGEQ